MEESRREEMSGKWKKNNKEEDKELLSPSYNSFSSSLPQNLFMESSFRNGSKPL